MKGSKYMNNIGWDDIDNDNDNNDIESSIKIVRSEDEHGNELSKWEWQLWTEPTKLTDSYTHSRVSHWKICDNSLVSASAYHSEST